MSVVLSILQIIGWILLAVLLLLVAAVLIVLFCPVHYLVEGEWLEEKWARFKAHWLLHLFRVRISYGDELVYGEIHALWKKISFSFDLTKKKEEEESEDTQSVADKAEDDAKDVYAEDKKEGALNKSADDLSDSKEKVIGTETAAELRGEADLKSDVNSNDDSNDASDESIVFKIKGIIERIKEIYPKIKKILTDEKNQAAVKHLKDEVIYLIKILLPKKSKIDAVFSTGSPDTTGQLFGILACFPAMYQKDWKLLPDFEADAPYFKGTFWGKGRLSGYQLAGILLRILFDKNCRRLYTMINKFLKWLKKDDKSQEEK